LRKEYIAVKRSGNPDRVETARKQWRQEADAYRKTLLDKQRRSKEEKKRVKLFTEPTLNNFWAFVKLGSATETKITVAKDQSGQTVFDKQAVKDAFYQEFKDRWAASEAPVPKPPSHSSQPGKHGSELDQEVTITELNTVIKELKPGKAVGLDGVSPEMIKCMTEMSRRYVLAFINKCIASRRMPEDLKKGRVKLLFKAEDRRVPKNYRPICVNSILAKLITRVITIRLTAIVEREAMLEDSQFGFRKNRSTLDAVVVLNTVVTGFRLDLKIRKKEGASDRLRDNLFIAFIDLEKAGIFACHVYNNVG